VILGDEPASWPVTHVEPIFTGAMLGVRRDTIEYDDETFQREVVTHPGAVAIVAVDSDDRVLVLRQYRHASQLVMVEIPAGLLDIEGEAPLEAAKRELREEGLVEADDWTPLFDMRPSAGSSTENIHLFLAEGLHVVEAPDEFTAQHEEATMTREWVDLDDLVEAVMAGRVANGLTIAGSLAVDRIRHGKHRSKRTKSS
jgi:8-oxo-dGTP pyrophosphatase MutT (NUDIX family)